MWIETATILSGSSVLKALIDASDLHDVGVKAANIYRSARLRLSGPTASKNHDVEIALRAAYLNAVLVFVKSWDSRLPKGSQLRQKNGFCETVTAYFTGETRRLSAERIASLSKKVGPLEGAHELGGTTDMADLDRVRIGLAQVVEAELAAEGIPVVYEFHAALRGGPTESVPPLAPFAAFLQVEIAEQIKTNDRFRNILLYSSNLSQQRDLAEIKDTLGALIADGITLAPADAAMIGRRFDELGEGYRAVSATLSSFRDLTQATLDDQLARLENIEAGIGAVREELRRRNANRHLYLTAHWRAGSRDAMEESYQSLRFDHRLDSFTGAARKELLQVLARDFLEIGKTEADDPTPLTYAILQGSAGQGKSRLAMELGEIAEANGYPLSGFLSLRDAMRGQGLNEDLVRAWEFPDNTFAVIDYAGQYHRRDLEKLLDLLGAKFIEGRSRCRLLLLIREQERGLGRAIKPVNASLRYNVARVGNDEAIVELKSLEMPELVALARRRITQKKTEQLTDADIERTIRDIAGDESVAHTPLFAAIVGQYFAAPTQDRSDRESRDKVFSDLVERERRTFWFPAGEDWSNADKKLFEDLLMVLTLLRGVRTEELPHIAKAVGIKDGDLDRFCDQAIDLLRTYAGDDDVIHPLEPDLLGEWYVLDRHKNMPPRRRRELLDIAWSRSSAEREIGVFVPLAWFDYPRRVAEDFIFGLPRHNPSDRRPWGEIPKEFASAVARLSASLQRLIAWRMIAAKDLEERTAAFNRAEELEARFRLLVQESGVDITEPKVATPLLDARTTLVSTGVAVVSERERRSIEREQEEVGTSELSLKDKVEHSMLSRAARRTFDQVRTSAPLDRSSDPAEIDDRHPSGSEGRQ